MRIFYSGDINIEHGGFFYDTRGLKYDYMDATRVTPCSDADGPNNQFWVEHLTVNIRKGAELQKILACIGVDELPRGAAARRDAMIDAHIAYGAYDVERVAVVQLGKHASHAPTTFNPVTSDVVLRGNTSLRRYVRQLHKGG
jgi:hypothetical protein